MRSVAIVGAGPVGLFLGVALARRGVTVRVLERRREPRDGSRSIGIHPPALEILDELGLGERFRESGVEVVRGFAFAGRRCVGKIDFDGCRGPFKFVLTVPQARTEAILRDALEAEAPGALAYGVEIESLTQDESGVTLATRGPDDAESEERHALAIACDGRHSRCREGASIGFDGRSYPGRYLMADAPDRTHFGSCAAVFLTPGGLVESFPLPRRRRRWVVRRADGSAGEPTVEPRIELAREITSRTGFDVEGLEEPSAFVAEAYVAERLNAGRLVLHGDAAHVVSPIGGQGMNLGWINAAAGLEALLAVLDGGPPAALDQDAKRRRRRANAARRRAEVNMWLGAPLLRHVRDPLVAALVGSPLRHALARVFTMRGLDAGV